MKKLNTYESRRRRATLVSLFLFLLAFGPLVACEGFTEVLNPVEPPEYTNPLDPAGDGWIAPTTTITSGPEDLSTVASFTVTFTWTGNELATVFQTRVTGGIFEGIWSPWNNATSMTMELLDELNYTFEVRSGYPSSFGDPEQIDDTPESRTFTVDAVQGPSLRFTPRVSLISPNDTIELDLVAEEVTDLTMVKIQFRYDPAILSYVAMADGAFLTSNGGDLLKLPAEPEVDEVAGMVEFNMGVAGADPPGVTGTGTIAILTFRALSPGQTDITFSQDNTLLRDQLNQGIAPHSLVPAMVIIQ